MKTKPLFDQRANRIRQTMDEPIERVGILKKVLAQALDKAEENCATRISLRALVLNELSEQIDEEASGLRFKREATIPLSHPFDKYQLSYFGLNSNARQSHESVLFAERALIGTIFSKDRRGLIKSTELQPLGVSASLLRAPLDAEDRLQLIALYKAGLPAYKMDVGGHLDEMIDQPHIHTLVGVRFQHNGKLCGLFGLETETIAEINGMPFVTKEFTSAVKLLANNDGEVAPGNIAHAIVPAIQDLMGYEEVVFSEVRAAFIAVNQAKYNMGMRYCGTLEKSIKIDGIEDVRESQIDYHCSYRNLNVWAFNRDDISLAKQAFEYKNKNRYNSSLSITGRAT